MKLIGKLKDNVANAETKEEAKQLIENAGMLLDDQELDQVSGGINGTSGGWKLKALAYGTVVSMPLSVEQEE